MLSAPLHHQNTNFILLVPQCNANKPSKEVKGQLRGSWHGEEACSWVWGCALLQPSSWRPTASIQPWEPWGAPILKPSPLEWQLDELGMRSLAFEEAITLLFERKKIAPDCAVCVYTALERQAGARRAGLGRREAVCQTVPYSPEILKGCLLEQAEGWELLKWHILLWPWDAGCRGCEEEQPAEDLSLWATGSTCCCCKCHSCHLLPLSPHGSLVAVSFAAALMVMTCHINNICWHNHLSLLLSSPFLNELRECNGNVKENKEAEGASCFPQWASLHAFMVLGTWDSSGHGVTLKHPTWLF